MFRRILVANRGEIAVRVIRTCREMGIESVAVYSDADNGALHTRLATHAVHIGAAPASDSYLSRKAVLDAVETSRADAVHPGYGFLSENAEFARACHTSGVAFIGPSPSAMALVGSKTSARDVAERAGVPVIPGEAPTDQSDAALLAAAHRVGFPVLLKPAEGGGGIGMKAVSDARDFVAAAAQARREAAAAFGEPTLYLERLLQQPRHVEFQIMADSHGEVVHLFERECSVQRRHQKVVEESPSLALSPGLRARMGHAAVQVAREARYTGAGTVEFLVEGTGDGARFYFLEVNARLQVEHPLTEEVVGVDLVRAQIEVAAGHPLPWSQADLHQRGHAIELRLYAEDPQQAYLPQAGHVSVFRPPTMPGVRIDSGIVEHSDVSVHYDPLLAKIIARGETREAARARALAALRAFPVLGLRTNHGLLGRILAHARFVEGRLDTHFLQDEHAALTSDPAVPAAARLVAEHLITSASDRAALQVPPGPSAGDGDPWTGVRAFHG